MNVEQEISPLLSTFWIVIPLMLLVLLFKSARFKGVLGKLLVKLTLKRSLNKELYQLIHNVTLPTEDGTIQIDHIVVSKFGVFVIETNNMKGWVFGTEFQKEWTQQIYKHSETFQNPLHQNDRHTEALQKILDLNDQQVFSVVVFVGDSTFKTVMPVNVVYGRGLVGFIKMNQRPVLSEGKVEEVINQIESGCLVCTTDTNKAHSEYVKGDVQEMVEAKVEYRPEGPSCPQCGCTMVRRVGRRGQYESNPFWGCSGFPYCRSIRSIFEDDE